MYKVPFSSSSQFFDTSTSITLCSCAVSFLGYIPFSESIFYSSIAYFLFLMPFLVYIVCCLHVVSYIRFRFNIDRLWIYLFVGLVLSVLFCTIINFVLFHNKNKRNAALFLFYLLCGINIMYVNYQAMR